MFHVEHESLLGSPLDSGEPDSDVSTLRPRTCPLEASALCSSTLHQRNLSQLRHHLLSTSETRQATSGFPSGPLDHMHRVVEKPDPLPRPPGRRFTLHSLVVAQTMALTLGVTFGRTTPPPITPNLDTSELRVPKLPQRGTGTTGIATPTRVAHPDYHCRRIRHA